MRTLCRGRDRNRVIDEEAIRYYFFCEWYYGE